MRSESLGAMSFRPNSHRPLDLYSARLAVYLKLNCSQKLLSVDSALSLCKSLYFLGC